MRYTQSGGEITLRLTHEMSDCIIEVIDNGPGIPVAEREQVFFAFYRVDGVSTEGSGLGLSIAKEAANRINAHISLHTNPLGNGLVFRVAIKITPTNHSS